MPSSTEEAKINAFENHMLKRKLLIASSLAKHFGENVEGDPLSESGFAILDLTVMYFETIEQFIQGKNSKGNSGEFIKLGFSKVFPKQVAIAHDFQEMLRNGIYHIGMPKDSFPISREHPEAISLDSYGNIVINPVRFVDAIIDHFERYIGDLRKCNGFEEFEKRWDMLCDARRFVAPIPQDATPNPMDSK